MRKKNPLSTKPKELVTNWPLKKKFNLKGSIERAEWCSNKTGNLIKYQVYSLIRSASYLLDQNRGLSLNKKIVESRGLIPTSQPFTLFLHNKMMHETSLCTLYCDHAWMLILKPWDPQTQTWSDYTSTIKGTRYQPHVDLFSILNITWNNFAGKRKMNLRNYVFQLTILSLSLLHSGIIFRNWRRWNQEFWQMPQQGHC